MMTAARSALVNTQPKWSALHRTVSLVQNKGMGSLPGASDTGPTMDSVGVTLARSDMANWTLRTLCSLVREIY